MSIQNSFVSYPCFSLPLCQFRSSCHFISFLWLSPFRWFLHFFLGLSLSHFVSLALFLSHFPTGFLSPPFRNCFFLFFLWLYPSFIFIFSGSYDLMSLGLSLTVHVSEIFTFHVYVSFTYHVCFFQS